MCLHTSRSWFLKSLFVSAHSHVHIHTHAHPYIQNDNAWHLFDLGNAVAFGRSTPSQPGPHTPAQFQGRPRSQYIVRQRSFENINAGVGVKVYIIYDLKIIFINLHSLFEALLLFIMPKYI